jgi:hypothetical protein
MLLFPAFAGEVVARVVLATVSLARLGCDAWDIFLIVLIVEILAIELIVIVIWHEIRLHVVDRRVQAGHKLVEILLVEEDLVLVISLTVELFLALRDRDVEIIRTRLLHVEKIGALPRPNLRRVHLRSVAIIIHYCVLLLELYDKDRIFDWDNNANLEKRQK